MKIGRSQTAIIIMWIYGVLAGFILSIGLQLSWFFVLPLGYAAAGKIEFVDAFSFSCGIFLGGSVLWSMVYSTYTDSLLMMGVYLISTPTIFLIGFGLRHAYRGVKALYKKATTKNINLMCV